MTTVERRAGKQFKIESYEVTLGQSLTATWTGAQIKAHGMVTCTDRPSQHRFIAYFLADDSPVPDPLYVVENRIGAIFLPFKEMGTFLDVLRNEAPLYAYVNSKRPEWNKISSRSEPVGEEES